MPGLRLEQFLDQIELRNNRLLPILSSSLVKSAGLPW